MLNRMLKNNTLPNNILKGKLLDDTEREDCKTFNLKQILKAKYDVYHGRAEKIWILVKPEELGSHPDGKEFLRTLAIYIGDCADQDGDFKKELLHRGVKEFYTDPFAIRLKHLLGMLAMENGIET